ncbi:methylosome protein WDR77-like isoform X3 [Dermacentor albipictus]|uniref:methylosome protein WDR77-like isoform X3 n=1 Tax=Dermacentor albipictus TaxID=60249 RepID=UPI0031FCB61D
MASVPCATFHKNIDDIKRCKDGSLVLACNNLFGTKWEGSVRLYKKVEDIPSLEECVASVNTDSTVADNVPLNPGRFMLGLDSGGVEMLQLAQEEPRLLDTVFYRRDHDGGITSLALSPDRRWLASTGWDFAPLSFAEMDGATEGVPVGVTIRARIKLWDMTSMECSRTYVAAHSDAVWKVVFSTDPNVFLSCSKDGKVQSWDMRLSKPATVLVGSRYHEKHWQGEANASVVSGSSTSPKLKITQPAVPNAQKTVHMMPPISAGPPLAHTTDHLSNCARAVYALGCADSHARPR